MSASHALELRVSSDPVNLAGVRKALEQFAAEQGFDHNTVAEVGLVVNEAMANVIRHAYQGRTDRPMHLIADADPRQLTIELRDWGNGVDPSRLKRQEHDPLKPGGVGMVCLKKWMDDITFTPQPDGMLMTMIRRRK
jgi:serine/threonine-protein kinase RsbW